MRGSSGPSSASSGSWSRAESWPAVPLRVLDGDVDLNEVRRHGMATPPDLDRRGFVRLTAATAAVLSTRVNAMPQGLTDVVSRTGDGQGADIRPFRFKASDADLTDLRRRINATKWPEREWVPDSSDGVPLHTMQNLRSEEHTSELQSPCNLVC